MGEGVHDAVDAELELVVLDRAGADRPQGHDDVALTFESVPLAEHSVAKNEPSSSATTVSLTGHGPAAPVTRRWSLDDLREAGDDVIEAQIVSAPVLPVPVAAAAAEDHRVAEPVAGPEPWVDVEASGDGADACVITRMHLGRLMRIAPFSHGYADLAGTTQSPDGAGEADGPGSAGWNVRDGGDTPDASRAPWNAGVLLLPDEWDDVPVAKPRDFVQVKAAADAARSAYAAIIAGAGLSVVGTAALVVGQVLGH